ncbi:MAG: FUSC family protein, partial [Chromatiaceae bacterium]
FETVADIRGFGVQTRQEQTERRSAPPWTLDPDRLTAAVRAFAAIWLILLAIIYIPGFPMPAGVVPVTAALVIQLAIMPQVSASVLLVPVMGGIAFAGAFHIFLMPHLSSFVGLGTAIFIGIFLICYLFSKPAQDLARSLVLAQFVMIIFVSNEQTYDFLYVANSGLMWLLGIGAVWVSGWFPIAFRPQQMVFTQLRRFLRSCDRLMVPQRGESGHWLRRMSLAFHVHEVTTLPGKLDRWLAALPAVAEGKVAREQVGALADSLQALSGRVRELVEVRGAAQSAAIVHELIGDMHAWRLGIQEVLLALAVDPAGMDARALRARLDAKLEALEARIETALDTAPGDGASTEEIDNMYRMLGAYRGLSETLVVLVQRTALIDWREVREERF